MKYVVKCFYCDKEFEVKRGESGADFICPECGEANNIKDVVERIEDTPTKEKEVDPDIETIKAFDMAQHPVINDETYYRNNEFDLLMWLENASSGQVVFFIIAVILVITLSIFAPIFLPQLMQ